MNVWEVFDNHPECYTRVQTTREAVI